MSDELKFVSYDGEFPNLCLGTLILELNGEEIVFPEYCLSSGGSVWFDDDWLDHIEKGRWTIEKFPNNFPKNLEKDAEKLVNKNVPWGCCGGCV